MRKTNIELTIGTYEELSTYFQEKIDKKEITELPDTTIDMQLKHGILNNILYMAIFYLSYIPTKLNKEELDIKLIQEVVKIER